MNRMRPALVVFGVIALVIALVVLVVTTRAIPVIERVASSALNRDVHIGGLEVDPGRITSITLENVRIDNPDWRPDTPLADIDAIRVDVAVVESLRRWRAVLPAVRIAGGAIDLHLDPEHGSNLDGMIDSDDAPRDDSRVLLDDLTISDVSYAVTAPARRLRLNGAIDAVPQAADDRLPITTTAAGDYQGRDVRIEAGLGGLDAWRSEGDTFPLRFTFTSGASRIEAEGSVAAPSLLAGFDVYVSIAGPTPAELGALFSLPLPDLPPYELQARFHRDGETYVLEDLAGTFGDSDINGRARFSRDGDRLQVAADMSSERLDFDDLAGVIGGAPDSGPGESASPEQAAADAERKDAARVMPATAFDYSALKRADITLEYAADSIVAPRLPLNDVAVSLQLDDGHLALTPFSLGIGGGEATFDLRLDPDGAVQLAGEFERVSLKAILDDLRLTQEAAGVVSGWLDVRSHGPHFAALMAHLDGALVMLTEGGRLDSVLVELLGLDVGESVIAFLADADPVTIRCGIVDFEAREGILDTQQILVDTDDSKIRGNGQIDLGEEVYALQLESRAKDLSLLSANSPIYVTGTFKQPEAGPKIGEALLSLLTPIEFGEPGDVDCRALLRERAAP